ncbi:MAG TPA: type II toxin-antitoxin system RelE/ParE family toxin [Pyrinomonadaceae bacterium]|nr:type II toxin-antitoxin system RelE/ParE family toxin [Pyrinomonadaceae bacterium]
MSDYSVTFTRSARKELESLPATLVDRIFPKIEALVGNPRPSGCKKLKGSFDLWRIRVGEYRVIYSILEKQIRIEIIAVRHRRKAYE